MNNNCGIYKITSPTGRVYIGQSKDIARRWKAYSILSNCGRQKVLYRSFIKHGVENHQFDIIEYCLEEDLNCSERFWQDEFSVINGGLNCVLQKCGTIKQVDSEEVKIKKSLNMMEGNNHRARKVIDTETLFIYDSAIEAARLFKINRSNMYQYLRGDRKNKTNLIWLKDHKKN